MKNKHRPFVSVVTPLGDGGEFFRECIESVISQTYNDFEYIILSNSADEDSLRVADEYSRRDNRVKIYKNKDMQQGIAGYNGSFEFISEKSKYCKMVLGEDWIYPECLEKMVGLAEENPNVGIVGAYQLSGGRDIWYVRNLGLPYSKTVISGRDICRSYLLGTQRVFGNPTSVLYRSDLVRNTDAFFPNPTQEADISACLKHLRYADFGFVHQVLAYERIHYRRATTSSLEFNAYVSAEISDCQEYGDWYLTRREREERIGELLDQYYSYLSASAFKFKDRKFWDYHAERLRDLGYQFDGRKLSMGIVAKAFDLILNPKETFQMLSGRIRLHYMLRGARATSKGG